MKGGGGGGSYSSKTFFIIQELLIAGIEASVRDFQKDGGRWCDGIAGNGKGFWGFYLQAAEQEIGRGFVKEMEGIFLGGGLGWMKRCRGESLVRLHFVYVYMREESGDERRKIHPSVGG